MEHSQPEHSSTDPELDFQIERTMYGDYNILILTEAATKIMTRVFPAEVSLLSFRTGDCFYGASREHVRLCVRYGPELRWKIVPPRYRMRDVFSADTPPTLIDLVHHLENYSQKGQPPEEG